MPDPDQPNKPSWKMRRRVFGITMVFSALIVFYVMFRWEDTRLAETLAVAAFALWGSVVAFYSGFATWEDIKLHDRPDRSPREEQPDLDHEGYTDHDYI